MVKLDYNTFEQAGENWDKYREVDSPYVTFLNGIDTFMGYDVYNTKWWNDKADGVVIVPENTIEKLKMLASPHFRTLLKAYEIKHGHPVYSSEQHTEQSS